MTVTTLNQARPKQPLSGHVDELREGDELRGLGVVDAHRSLWGRSCIRRAPRRTRREEHEGRHQRDRGAMSSGEKTGDHLRRGFRR